MEPCEPPDFEQMTKEGLIAFAMPIEEVDIRRYSLAVDLIGAIRANMAQFCGEDVALLSNLWGGEPPSPPPEGPAIKIEESQIAQMLNGVHAGLQEMSREELIDHIGRLTECLERRTAVFQGFVGLLGNGCDAFSGANIMLSQVIRKPQKGH